MNMDKWTQQLHDKLAEREVAPPDDLWADIEAALPTSAAGSDKPRTRFVSLHRWAVAASVALLVAGGGYLLWSSSSTSEAPTSASQSELSQAEPAEAIAPTESQPHREENHGDWLNDSSAAKIRVPVPVIRPSSPLMAQTSETFVKDSLNEVIEPTSTEQPASSNSELADNNTPIQQPSIERDVDETIHQMEKEIALLSSKSHKDISVNLYASNGLSDMQRVNGVRMADELAARYDFEKYLPKSTARTRGAGPIYLYGYEERQKHHQPIAFGLSVSYPLSTKWLLSTGVTYTRLHSDFASIINGTSISQEQTLHYLGIPLNAQYRLFHLGGLNVYLSGGAEADYNIKARLESMGVTQHIDRDRWQFSVQGGVGVQYDVLPQLGIYVEPGVKYYFDNGSRLRNFFKDKPTSLNLQLGLRLNIKQ
jgi:opacity protein-like surface antigen